MLHLVVLSLVVGLSASQSCNTDVMFILDASGSVEQNYRNMIEFTMAISKFLKIEPNGHRVAFIAYSGRHTKILAAPFGTIKSNEEFVGAVENLPHYKGTTYTGRALRRALELMEDRRRDATTVVIVVTDGFSHDPVEEAAKKLRDLPKTTVYVAAIPDLISRSGMIAISGHMDRIFFQPGVVQKASDALMDILRCTPARDPTTPRPTPRPTRPVTTTRRTTTTTTTRATTTTQRITGCELDLLFVFDFSGSVSGIHQSYVDAALDVLGDLRVDPFFTRVAMLKYSSKAWATPVFHLRDYETEAEVREAIRREEYMGGTTNTAWALEVSREEFEPQWGGRPGLAQQVAVLFTDGYSQHDPTETARSLRSEGVELFAVATETEDYPPNFDELRLIATDAGHVFDSSDIQGLRSILQGYNRNCRRN